MFDDVTKERFWSKVDKSAGPDECWPWRAAQTGAYGRFVVDGRNMSAHRVSLALATGRYDLFEIRGVKYDVPNIARHMCHNKRCVNPSHLRWGTPADNSGDRPASCVEGASAKANATKAKTGRYGGVPAQPISQIPFAKAYLRHVESIKRGQAEAKARRDREDRRMVADLMAQDMPERDRIAAAFEAGRNTPA